MKSMGDFSGIQTKIDEFSEAITTSEEESDSSSVDEEMVVDVTRKSSLLECVGRVRTISEDLEDNFRASNSLDNQLLMEIVLLGSQNHSLNRKIAKNELEIKKSEVLEKSSLESEVRLLRNTIADMESKLGEREKMVQELCHKYMYLKKNKDAMEKRYEEYVQKMEQQWESTQAAFWEVKEYRESEIQEKLLGVRHPYEALFLREKLRCNQLMYDNLKLVNKVRHLEVAAKEKTFVVTDIKSAEFLDEAIARLPLHHSPCPPPESTEQGIM